MINTPLGNIKITVNGSEFRYTMLKLENQGSNFKVAERYKIVLEIVRLSEDYIILVELENDKNCRLKNSIESGENLSMISYYRDSYKLSIGAINEIPFVKNEYTNTGIKTIIKKTAEIKKIVFGIAWIKMDDIEKEDIYTWFAADPNMF